MRRPASPVEILEQVCQHADLITEGALREGAGSVEAPEIQASYQQGVWHVEVGQASGSGPDLESAAAQTLVRLAFLREFFSLPIDSETCAELACALTERCGFPVLVAFSPREPTSVVAYPVPGVP